MSEGIENRSTFYLRYEVDMKASLHGRLKLEEVEGGFVRSWRII
jgi:hypothetical protein